MHSNLSINVAPDKSIYKDPSIKGVSGGHGLRVNGGWPGAYTAHRAPVQRRASVVATILMGHACRRVDALENLCLVQRGGEVPSIDLQFGVPLGLGSGFGLGLGFGLVIRIGLGFGLPNLALGVELEQPRQEPLQGTRPQSKVVGLGLGLGLGFEMGLGVGSGLRLVSVRVRDSCRVRVWVTIRVTRI